MTRPKVVLFDLWETLIFSDEQNPIDTVRLLLNGDDLAQHPEFVTECLTNGTKRPGRFLKQVAQRTGRSVTDERGQLFRELLARERRTVTVFGDVSPTIAALHEQGIRLGIISNLWPFAVRRIKQILNAESNFETIVLSCEVGLRKPDARIFELAARQLDVEPADCLMVGDSVSSDMVGAVEAGMQAALIDRDGTNEKPLPDGVVVLRDLRELPALVA